MDRRTFSQTIFASVVVPLLPPTRHINARQVDLRISGERLLGNLRTLAQFGATKDGGISRVAYSEADLNARAFVHQLMHSAGLETDVDVAGNLIGRRAVAGSERAPLMIGSHIDSVPHGGNYDGQVGSMGAVEVAHTLHDQNIELRHPLEVIIFQNEEGGKTGSRALSGELQPKELDLVTASGTSIREGIALLGGDPAALAEARRTRGGAAGYLELHIEQGGILERERIDIGVVQGIVGIKRWAVTIEGFANHAGTTPMSERQDALLAGGMFITAVNDTAKKISGRHVATVGRITAHPGAPNVIPGRVELSLEIRDLSMQKIDSVYAAVVDASVEIEAETKTTFSFDEFYVSRAAPTDPRYQQFVADAATSLGLSSLPLPSGAGHDAQSVAHFAPVGMIFVPSVGGISHSPKEFTRPEQIVGGANVLLQALLMADAAEA